MFTPNVTNDFFSALTPAEKIWLEDCEKEIRNTFNIPLDIPIIIGISKEKRNIYLYANVSYYGDIRGYKIKKEKGIAPIIAQFPFQISLEGVYIEEWKK